MGDIVGISNNGMMTEQNTDLQAMTDALHKSEQFTLLPEELQKDIIKCHPEKDITRDMFELNLKELEKAW